MCSMILPSSTIPPALSFGCASEVVELRGYRPSPPLRPHCAASPASSPPPRFFPLLCRLLYLPYSGLWRYISGPFLSPPALAASATLLSFKRLRLSAHLSYTYYWPFASFACADSSLYPVSRSAPPYSLCASPSHPSSLRVRVSYGSFPDLVPHVFSRSLGVYTREACSAHFATVRCHYSASHLTIYLWVYGHADFVRSSSSPTASFPFVLLHHPILLPGCPVALCFPSCPSCAFRFACVGPAPPTAVSSTIRSVGFYSHVFYSAYFTSCFFRVSLLLFADKLGAG